MGIVSAQYLDVGVLPGADGGFLCLPRCRQRDLRSTRWRSTCRACSPWPCSSGSLAERLRSARAGLQDASYEIADLRAFNDHVIDCLVSGLVTADANCRVLTFNRAASKITGLPVEDARGRDVHDVLQLPRDQSLPPASVAGARTPRIEVAYRAAGKPDHRHRADDRALQFPEGTSGYLFTFQDITELKRLERDARLQQRLAAVGEMAAGIAHEIRNPLAAMSGSIAGAPGRAAAVRRAGRS